MEYSRVLNPYYLTFRNHNESEEDFATRIAKETKHRKTAVECGLTSGNGKFGQYAAFSVMLFTLSAK